MRKITLAAAFFLSAAAVSGCRTGKAAPAAAEPPADYVIADGRAIAQKQCASCHAIDMAGASPNRLAPPFRQIGRRYKFPVLEQELDEGIKLGHPSMPRFQFTPRGTDSLLAYMRSIQAADRTGGTAAPE